MTPPYWFRLSPSLVDVDQLVPFKSPLRRNSNASPWKLLVPDLVTAVILPPAWTPFEAVSALVSTLNSWSASGNGKGTLALSHGLLNTLPSSQNASPKDCPPLITYCCVLGYPPLPATPCTITAGVNWIMSVATRPLSGNSRIRRLSIT